MKVSIKENPSCQELKVSVTYGQKTDLVERVLNFLETVDKQLPCFQGKKVYQVNVSDIYYIESVDKKAFVYLRQEVYQTDLRLYQLAEELARNGFVQISKSCILNINILDSIRPIFNSRMEAKLTNGEKLIINRSYLKAVKEVLKGEG